MDEKNRISNEMNINQLLYRLSDDKLNLIKSGYRSKLWAGYKDADSEKIKIQSDIVIGKKSKEKYAIELPYFVVSADYLTGKVLNAKNFKDIVDKEDLTLEKLLEVLNKDYQNTYDLSELICCIYNHICDVNLRDKILQLAALKLLYSKETTPERGYERAKHLINEFNTELNTNLSTKEIETIICKDYSISKQNLETEKLNKKHWLIKSKKDN